METVEVLVRMPKEDYMFIKTMVENGYEPPSSYYYNIASGTVLPKGHGKLKDIDKIISDGTNKGFCEWYDEMEYAPTVIEADKEVSK